MWKVVIFNPHVACAFSFCCKGEIQELVLGMPHRGRLNLLTSLLKFPAAQMFSKVGTTPKTKN